MERNNDDKTKQVLQGILADLYQKQASGGAGLQGSYLVAQDKQYLGTITSNRYDQNSLLNKYGPYGSRYSPTSIFNQYSQYGSRYGAFSLNNPYSSTPPQLFIKGKFFTHVTENRFIKPQISPEIFFYNLENNIDGLASGQIIENQTQLRQRDGESFVEAADGTYLGSLNPNQFENESILNQFGDYGSQFSPLSIYNQFGTYGSPYSQFSPYNTFSNQPPKVYVKGKFVAYLTKNQFMNPRLDPDSLKDWTQNNIPWS